MIYLLALMGALVGLGLLDRHNEEGQLIAGIGLGGLAALTVLYVAIHLLP